MTRGNISHIALTVSDLERSTAFYNKVFELIGKSKSRCAVTPPPDHDAACFITIS
jgi:predicted enzyme related to lactoylglutathione lyase